MDYSPSNHGDFNTMAPKRGSQRWTLGVVAWIVAGAVLLATTVAVVQRGRHQVVHDENENGPSVVAWLRATAPTEDHGDSTSAAAGGAIARILQVRWSPLGWDDTVDTDTDTDESTNVQDAPSDQPLLPPIDLPTASPPEEPTDSGLSFAEAIEVDPNPVPRNPPEGYFNYDVDDGDYGPRRWHRVDTDRVAPWYELSEDGFGPWKGHLADDDPTKNRCESRRLQSPIDLNEQKGDGIKCDALHKIKTRGGYYRLSGDRITKKILPNKLQLDFLRRPCLDWDDMDCREPRPPMADYPRYSSGKTHFSDLLQWDLKVPAEHKMEGEEFDAEIQMLHSHIESSRVTEIGILIRAKEDGFNEDFQIVLDQFQKVYDANQQQCLRRRLSGLNATAHQEFDAHRQLQMDESWDPYSGSFMRTIYFFRYDGSYTEPPCTPLTWFVMSKPMIISTAQLNQIKYLLFTNVDPDDCSPTSVHTEEQSVARPLQEVQTYLEVQKCTEDNFDSSD